MDLYFSPLACSLATRIALYEAGADANYLEVDPKTKHVLQDKSDFRNVAERFPDANISAQPGLERTRLQQWLCFIGTELHKALFVPLLDAKAPADAKAYALQKNLSRLDYVNTHLEGREFLLDHFSVADAYLVTILNWTQAVPAIDLAKWPAIKAYYDRVRQRPSVLKASGEEFTLYKAELARHKAA